MLRCYPMLLLKDVTNGSLTLTCMKLRKLISPPKKDSSLQLSNMLHKLIIK